ncbi:hypothetical protein C7M84_008765 [Penaeus vannamei]|uniref:SNF2 N-terminal domain-containing protein n=1 Tax=Penaeus vannamei TaxID=6689 RepID=A0A423T8N9_PENVA|nr:hypothetical protein C7M84_008765 [Penaeus vannamei]
MRRSLAPSQLLKRSLEINRESDDRIGSPVTSKRKKTVENECSGIPLSPYRAPLHPIVNSTQQAPSTPSSSHEALIKKILAKPFKIPIPNYVRQGSCSLGIRRNGVRRPLHDPEEPNALVFVHTTSVVCARKTHRKFGVKFMYDCVTGKQIEDNFGCIMADEMGLGKTLQCITLLWTLLRQGPDCKPLIEKAIVWHPPA